MVSHLDGRANWGPILLSVQNLLLKHPAKSAVKVIDFGSSCFENEKGEGYFQGIRSQ